MNTVPIIDLTPPLLTDTYIGIKISCIRPHRERMFKVSMEHDQDKFIFHNYGHGGTGWTFLFGCVAESIRQFEAAVAHNPDLKTQPICVIGAGCYGMLTAIMLAQHRFKVQIIAKETEDIASYKAAGFFFPRWRKSSTDHEKEMFLARGLESYTTYLQIAAGTHPFIKTGARIVPAYFGPNIDPGFDPYIQKNLIEPAQQVTINFGNGKHYSMNEYRIIFMDTESLMHELRYTMNQLKIPIVKREIFAWADISESIIFNCSGWGAKQLTQDPKLLPIQGHLISLKNQPVLNYMINVKVTMQTHKGPRDELIYFAPKGEGVLGITFLRNQDSPTANQHEFDRLLQRSRDFFGI